MEWDFDLNCGNGGVEVKSADFLFLTLCHFGSPPMNPDTQNSSKFWVPTRDFSFSKVEYGLESKTLSAFGFLIYQKVILGFSVNTGAPASDSMAKWINLNSWSTLLNTMPIFCFYTLLWWKSLLKRSQRWAWKLIRSLRTMVSSGGVVPQRS